MHKIIYRTYYKDNFYIYESAEIEKRTATIEKEDEGEERARPRGVDVEREDDNEEESVTLEELQQQLNEIRNNLAQNDGLLDDVILNKLAIISFVTRFISDFARCFYKLL